MAAALGCSALTGCDKEEPPPPPVLQEIQVEPANGSIAKGTSQSFTASGLYSDNTNRDISDEVTWATSDDAIAVISAAGANIGLLTGQSEGQVTVSATLDGLTGQTTLNVRAALLSSLQLDPVNPKIPLGLTEALTATGTFSDDSTQALSEQVTWSSSNDSVASVDSSGTVEAKSIGTATITAQLGEVSASTEIEVTDEALVSIEIAPLTPSLAIGLEEAFEATGIFTDKSSKPLTDLVTWTSSDDAVATIGDSEGDKGLARGLALGTTTIAASYGEVSESVELTVTDIEVISLQITPIDATVAQRQVLQLTATATLSDGSTDDLTSQVTWTSSDDDVASVSNASNLQGQTSGHAPGTVTITAAFEELSAETPLTVSAVPLQQLVVDPADSSMALSTTAQLSATGIFADDFQQDLTAQVAWGSADKSIAQVNSQGVVTGVAEGQTQIIASLEGISGVAELAVSRLESLQINPATPEIPLGRDLQLAATGTLANSANQDMTDNVTWTSSDEAVAQIGNASDNRGLAVSLDLGKTTVGASFEGVSTQVELAVTDAELESIDILPPNAETPKGIALRFTASGSFSDGVARDITSDVTWSSDNELVAQISNAEGSRGEASALEVGSATITAELDGQSASVALTVTPEVLESIVIESAEPGVPLPLGLSRQFFARGIFSDGSDAFLTEQVLWTSSEPLIATISNAGGSQGLVTSVAEGQVVLAAQLQGITGEVNLEVSEEQLVSIAITPDNLSIALGFEQAFQAHGTFTDNVVRDISDRVLWSSTDDSIVSVSIADGSKGLASTHAIGSASISAEMDGVTESAAITVTDEVLVSIAITPESGSIPLGTNQSFTAEGTFSDGSTQDLTAELTWIAGNPDVAVFSNAPGQEGLAISVGVGTTEISVSRDGVSATVSFEVNDAELQSLRIEPADASIPVGSSLQLRAIGTFTDGEHDITADVAWGSSDASVAAISNLDGQSGEATGLAAGQATITATFDGESAVTTLTVVSGS